MTCSLCRAETMTSACVFVRTSSVFFFFLYSFFFASIMRCTMLRLASSTSQSNLDGALTLSKRSIKESCCWVPGADHSASLFYPPTPISPTYIQETGSDGPLSDAIRTYSEFRFISGHMRFATLRVEAFG